MIKDKNSVSIITIKDISNMMGCSVSTVSKALNNKKDINIETKNRIRSIAMKYNFTPNNLAVSLRKKRSKTIAILLPQINSLFSPFISAFQTVAFEQGYKILLFQTFEKMEEYENCMKNLNDWSIDGIMVLSNKKRIGRLKNVILLPYEFKVIAHTEYQNRLNLEAKDSFMALLNKIKS